MFALRRTLLTLPSVRLAPAGVVVVLLAVTSSVAQWTAYADAPRERWCSTGHDRNAHYLYGLAMATELRNGRLGAFLAEFDAGSMVWPPLHGMLLAAVLTVAGPDPRLAVLPSVFGYALTVIFAHRLGRRLVPGFGELAGLTAAGLMVLAPAVRAYSADVMIESLGLAATLAALLAGVEWLQAPDRRTAARLGAALTALFFVKYNYWLLFAAAIGATMLAVHFQPIWQGAKTITAAVSWRSWLLTQLRRPLNFIILGLLVAAAYTEFVGGWSVSVGGRTVGMKTTRVVANVAYGLFLLRILHWWRTGGASLSETHLGPSAKPIVYWHLLPVGFWLLLPLRLRYFVWYVSTANSDKPAPPFLDAANFYWNGFVAEYTDSLPLAVGVVALTGVALVAGLCRKLRPAAGLVLLFLGLSAVLAIKHPNQKLRYEHSWAPVAFVLAGAGLAAVANLHRKIGFGIAAISLVGLAAVAGPAAVRPGFAEERGLNGAPGSTRDLSDVILPYITDADGVLILGNTVVSPWAKWSYVERFGRTTGVQVDFRSVGWYARITPDVFAQWVKTTNCTAVVYVDVPVATPLWEPPTPDGTDAALMPLMGTQTTFRHVTTTEVPGRGWVTVWKR